jgi:hypothetical protein
VDRTTGKRTSRRLVLELILVLLTSVHAGLPRGDSYAAAWRSVPRHHPLLIAHILVGAVILVEALVFLIRCLRHGGTGWRVLTAAGFLLALVAFAAGDRYLAIQRDAAIDVMGIAWFAALLTYAAGWYLSRRSLKADLIRSPR